MVTFRSASLRRAAAPNGLAERVAELGRGATGQAVREVQRKLLALGYLTAADVASGPGVFGPRTESAVMAFQVRHGLKRSGVVGRYTQAALAKALLEQIPEHERPTTPRVAIVPPPAENTFSTTGSRSALRSS